MENECKISYGFNECKTQNGLKAFLFLCDDLSNFFLRLYLSLFIQNFNIHDSYLLIQSSLVRGTKQFIVCVTSSK